MGWYSSIDGKCRRVSHLIGLAPGYRKFHSIPCLHWLLTHSLLSSRLHACGGWIFVGDISKAEVGGALPRWRPPPHSRLPDLKFKLKSLLRVHEIKGIRLKFGSLHAESILGLRLLVFCIEIDSWSSLWWIIFVENLWWNFVNACCFHATIGIKIKALEAHVMWHCECLYLMDEVMLF